MNESTAAQMLDRFYERQVRRVADQFRDCAERIEREGLGSRVWDNATRHRACARNVVHEVQTLLGNLPLDTLLSAADDAADAFEPEPASS